MLYDGEAQPQTAILSRGRRIGLAEPLKHMGKRLGGDANAGVGHGNLNVRIHFVQKDLNLALESAKKLGLALPHTASAQQLFSVCVANGGREWDHSGTVKALELMSNHQVTE